MATRKKQQVKRHPTDLALFCKRESNGRFVEVLSDNEIDLARQLYEEYPLGHPKHIGIRKLAKKFEVSRQAMNNYVHYRKRVERLT